jgi:high-affinity iron transporter
MLQMLVITMREGIEAFLIVAITAAYLRKTGRTFLLPAVFWGTGVAIVLSVIASLFFRQADNKPLWEGVLAAIAAVLVTGLTVYMWRTARYMRKHIGERLEAHAQRAGFGAVAGVFAFTLLMITREGMETALILSSLAFSTDSRDMFWGAVLGVSLAGVIAWLWSRYGHRVNLARFFQVTAVFLVIFSVQLMIYAVHEFFEAGVVPGLDNQFWHMATEPYGPEGLYGQWLSYLMVMIPAGWLCALWLKDRLVKDGSHKARGAGSVRSTQAPRAT